MKVYLLEDHELPLVHGTALIRTGNLFDPAGKIGLASVTGDAIRSGGTSKLSGDQIDEQLENIAADVESQIDETSGSLSFSTLKERTDEVMTLFHDVLTDPAFREDKIELWKAQTSGGIERRNDEPMGITAREYLNILYGRNNSYGWTMEHADVCQSPSRRYRSFLQALLLSGQHHSFRAGRFFRTPEMRERIEKLSSAGGTTSQPPVPAFPKVTNQAGPGALPRHKN